MSDVSVQLRPARPDRDDGLRFARYLNVAAEGFFQFLLGRGYEQVLAEAFPSTGHDLSYEHATFAEREGSPVGMISCYSAEQHRSASDRPLRDAPGYPALRASAIGFAFAPIMRVLDTLEDGDFYLQAIAVDEAARGAGIGSLLIREGFERARAAGCGRVCLDVSSGNAGARGLYDRVGMNVIAQSPRIFFAPRFRLLRMAKTL